MMKARRLTSELSRCRQILFEIIADIEEVLPSYQKRHLGTPQQHDVAEVMLFFRNLRHQLEAWSDGEEGAHAEDPLSKLFNAAEQCDRLVAVLSHHHGDARLDHAMGRLAECLRLTGPGVLRWQHGGRGGKADQALAAREKRVHQDLDSLRRSLRAA